MAELVDVDRSPISWREAGSGDVVAFLHGLGSSRTGWDAQLRDLSDRWRCAAWDMPGYGASPPVEPLTFDTIVDAAVGWLDTLGAGSAHLVGLSFGGMHALHLALAHPERARSLILVDTSPAFGLDGTTAADWIDARLAPLDEGLVPAQFARTVLKAIAAPGFDGDPLDQAEAAFARVGADGFRAAVRCLPDHDVRHRLAELSIPTLVVVGEVDEETPVSYARALAGSITGSRLEILPGAGHLTPAEAPCELNRCIRSFLEELDD